VQLFCLCYEAAAWQGLWSPRAHPGSVVSSAVVSIVRKRQAETAAFTGIPVEVLTSSSEDLLRKTDTHIDKFLNNQQVCISKRLLLVLQGYIL